MNRTFLMILSTPWLFVHLLGVSVCVDVLCVCSLNFCFIFSCFHIILKTKHVPFTFFPKAVKVISTGIMLESLKLNQLILKTPAQVDT